MPKQVNASHASLKGQRVIVAGAGLAGLVAARDLAARGADVHVVEARKRLGGRVWTDREFADDPVELGGEFIDESHDAMRSLCKELKLDLQPVLKEGFGLALDVNGRVQVMNGMKQAWADLKQALAQEAAAFESVDCDWGSAAAQTIGRHSMRALLEARGASREALATAESMRGFFLADPDELSALVAVEQTMAWTDPGDVKMSRIKGGNDRLVDALAKHSRAKVTMHAPVTRIDQDDKEVRVAVADGSKKGAILKGDYLVCTLPPTVARGLEFTPSVPSSLKRAWQAISIGAATKAHVWFDKPWWRKAGRPRAFGSNLDTGAIWESGSKDAVLTMLAGGRASQALRGLLEESGPQRVVRRLSWLGDPGDARDFRSVSWELDPFARGGYAVFGPGFKPEWRSELARSFGRVVFAGDHTSRKWQGYMNGAIESGQRAARDIELMTLLPF